MTMKVKMRVSVDFPEINVEKELHKVAKKVVIPLLTANIDANEDMEGRKHPQLSIQTIKRKGHSHPLIDEGILRKAFSARKATKAVLVRIKPSRRKIARYLQIDGVGKLKKKFFFFAVTDGMEADAMDMMSKWITRYVRKANGK